MLLIKGFTPHMVLSKFEKAWKILLGIEFHMIFQKSNFGVEHV
jgi:hypothetical protein